MKDLQEQVEIIEKSNREIQITNYADICPDCSFEFIAMTHWVKDGCKYVECGDCGEVVLLK